MGTGMGTDGRAEGALRGSDGSVKDGPSGTTRLVWHELSRIRLVLLVSAYFGTLCVNWGKKPPGSVN
jgi:hypothetical protein